MTIDRPFLGIMLMLGFCVLAPVGDAIAKILGQTVPIGQLVLVRFAVQALLLIPLVWLTRRRWRMSKRVTWLTFVRTILHIIGIGAMVTALKYLPLADAVAIAFVMPFIMLVLGKYALNEEVGARRIIACAVGFLGTLLVVQPSFAQVGWPALLPVGVAINFALFMLVTRQIAKETDPISLQAVSGVMAVFVILPVLLIFQNSGFLQLQIVHVSSYDWTLLLSIGLLGTVAHLLMTWSLRFAPSATLAPMQYLEIPFATIIGFMVFGDFPNPMASVGIVITIAAGLYVVLRERAIALSLTARATPAQPAEGTRAA
ncbi:DMT family transporter [Roseobacter litoralis]|uniref:Integral membrane protein n=1 Tax=Roseobacter litoralis (strain ATCC 49566 / DSM 6996 / JCM 21268 / NBRC 15278 / OCh 149) TaxID=391595 RepID=F7ZB28_ROSLO|nr:DMT family transporter [Roseobacter litoralis]AEI93021.1 putative integral membrane protein [Roseobacter litoralis Och 149]